MKVTIVETLDKVIDEFCSAHSISRDEGVEKCVRMALLPLSIEPWGFRKTHLVKKEDT